MHGQNSKREVPREVAPYFQFRSELTIFKRFGLQRRTSRVPHALRREMKTKLHHGHPGIEGCKALVRQIIFWPGTNAELTELVSNCSARIENRSSLQREPLMNHEAPLEPRQKVGMHLFYFKGKNYCETGLLIR